MSKTTFADNRRITYGSVIKFVHIDEDSYQEKTIDNNACHEIVNEFALFLRGLGYAEISIVEALETVTASCIELMNTSNRPLP